MYCKRSVECLRVNRIVIDGGGHHDSIGFDIPDTCVEGVCPGKISYCELNVNHPDSTVVVHQSNVAKGRDMSWVWLLELEVVLIFKFRIVMTS